MAVLLEEKFGSFAWMQGNYCYLAQINLVRGLRHDPTLAHEPWECCFGFPALTSLALCQGAWIEISLSVLFPEYWLFLCFTHHLVFCCTLLSKYIKGWGFGIVEDIHSRKPYHTYNNTHTPASKPVDPILLLIKLLYTLYSLALSSAIIFCNYLLQYHRVTLVSYHIPSGQSNQKILNMNSSGVVTRGDGWYCVSYHISSLISESWF